MATNGIVIDIIARIHERNLKRETDKLQREAERAGFSTGKKLGDSIERGMGQSSLKSERAMDRLVGTMSKARREQEEFNRLQKDSSTTSRQLINAQTRLESIYRRQDDALRSLGRSMRNANIYSQDAQKGVGGLRKQIQELGTSAFLTTRGLGTLAAIPLIPALVDATHVVVGATKSIALLPAVASAAAAGMGTLALATSGFTDTIKDIRDPEKFAKAIQGLSPNAQQAALSIRNLLPEFDKLKAATQDAFFKGFGEEIHNLANQYLPTIKNMTTSIATSFNNMVKGVGTQLLTNETQGAIKNLTGNISSFFERVTPAAGKLADAFFNIASTGSDFLPGFGQNIAKAASDFAHFIDQAQKSGQLKQWIQEGIDSVAALGNALKDITVAIYQTFGTDSEYSIKRFKATMDELLIAFKAVVIALDLLTGHFGSLDAEVRSWTGWPGKIRDALLDIPEALATVANAAIGWFDRMAERLTNLINGPLKWMSDLVNKVMPGDDINLQMTNDIAKSRIPVGDWASGAATPPTATAGGDAIVTKDTPGAVPIPGTNQWYVPNALTRGGLAGIHDIPQALLPQAGLGPYSEQPVPAAPPEKEPKGKKPPLNIAKELYSLSNIPLGAFPGAAGMGPGMVPGIPDPTQTGVPMTRYGMNGAPEVGQYEVDPGKVFDAETRVYSAQGAVEDARRRVLEMQADANSDQNDIVTAQRDIVERERAYIAAIRELGEAQQGTWKKMEKNANSFADGMQKIGVALDDDLGISKGLPGIAENLVRFFAGLAAAPVIGRLTGITASLGTSGSGSGLLGMLAPRQNAFGQAFPNVSGQYPMPGQTGGQYQYPGTSTQYPGTSTQYPGTSTTPLPPGSSNLAAMMSLAQSSSGKVKYSGASDMVNGLADCSGSISDLVEVLKSGKSTPARLFDTTAFSSDEKAAAQGFLPGYQPGALNVGVTPLPGMSGHMAATLPNGVNFEGGGGTGGGAQYGGSATGALDPQFSKQYHMPVGGAAAPVYGPPSTPPATNKPVYGPPMPTTSSYAPLTDAQLTNPALTNPTPTGGIGTGAGIPGLAPPPSAIPFGGVTGGGNLGAMPHAGASTAQPGRYPGTGLNLPGGSGGLGASGGGLIGLAQSAIQSGIAAGGMAGDIAGGGGGGSAAAAVVSAMAQIGIDELNRAIEFGSQVAGIGVGGLMETFLPNESPLADVGNSWFGRIAGAVAGIAPASANVAGQLSQQVMGQQTGESPPPLTPDQVAAAGGQGQGTGPAPGPVNNINVTNNRATEDQNGKTVAKHLEATYRGPGR